MTDLGLIENAFDVIKKYPLQFAGLVIGFFSFQFDFLNVEAFTQAHFILICVGLGLGAGLDFFLTKKLRDPLAKLDKLRGKRRIQFMRVLFSVMGHIAKADGRVSEEEIKVARGIMAELDLSKDEVDMAIKGFTRGKDVDYPLANNLYDFYERFRYNIGLRERFVRVQIQAVLAGDGVSRVVDQLLRATAAQLDIPTTRVNELLKEARIHNSFTIYGRKTEKVHTENSQYGRSYGKQKNADNGFSNQRRNYSREQNKRSYADPARQQRDDLAEAYILLGVSVADKEKAIKRAYRRLLSQHHPDKVVGQGGGSAEKELANAKTIEIRKAYELICEKRGF